MNADFTAESCRKLSPCPCPVPDNRPAFSSRAGRLGSIIVASILSLACLSARADERWPLPARLDDSNTKVTFEVDSTWHLIRGKTHGVRGTVSAPSPEEISAIHIDFEVPVATFDTDHESRDERLREVMAAESFPSVRFEGTKIEGCTPQKLETSSCTGALHGSLTIRGTTKPITIPLQISKVSNGPQTGQLAIHGDLPLQWADYAVEDPSIIVAHLDPTVTVHFDVILERK